MRLIDVADAFPFLPSPNTFISVLRSAVQVHRAFPVDWPSRGFFSYWTPMKSTTKAPSTLDNL
jgi:hypothetical protein